MTWEDIINWQPMIIRIAGKYSGDCDLRDDVVSEVMLALYLDKKLDINKFDPNKRNAAIRTVIRNNVITVLKSKKIGRFTMESLDSLLSKGVQIDRKGNIFYPGEGTSGMVNLDEERSSE